MSLRVPREPWAPAHLLVPRAAGYLGEEGARAALPVVDLSHPKISLWRVLARGTDRRITLHDGQRPCSQAAAQARMRRLLGVVVGHPGPVCKFVNFPDIGVAFVKVEPASALHLASGRVPLLRGISFAHPTQIRALEIIWGNMTHRLDRYGSRESNHHLRAQESGSPSLGRCTCQGHFLGAGFRKRRRRRPLWTSRILLGRQGKIIGATEGAKFESWVVGVSVRSNNAT